MIRIDDERGDVVFVVNSFLSGNRMGKEKHDGWRPFVLFHLKAARILRAPLIRAAFRGLVESDAGTLRNEVPASLSPRPPG